MREESRARILRSALRLFGECGYDGASVRRIAEDAGVARGLLYNYFDGKEGLLRALFAESMADVRATFAAADAGATPLDRLERLLRACVDQLRRNGDFWRLSYGVRMQPAVLALLEDSLPDWTAEIRGTLAGYLAGIGVADPAVEGRVLFAIIDGVSQHYVLEPDDYPVDDVLAAILARYAPPSSAAR